ncbi:MAG: tetratricopeptide repeat protein [Planctomycetaceae bacterium]|nr:tetratricopeptide repeat protein [Planctomycetaceae bacterium]
MMLHLILTLLLIWGTPTIMVYAAPQSESEAESQFYEGLRQRGLFTLVESTLQDQLAEVTLTPEQEDFLRLELSRTYASHAGHRLGEEQRELWRLAGETINADVTATFRSKWSAYLQVQSALIPLQETRFQLEQFRLMPHNRDLRKRVASELQEHLKSLRKVETSLSQQSNQVLARFRENPRSMAPFEFRSVQKLMIFEVALTLSQIAEVEFDSVEGRRPAIRAALERLRTLTGGAEDESMTWESRVLAIRCEWLQGDYETARTLAKRYSGEWPHTLSDEVLAEEAEIDLATGQPDLAFERLTRWKLNQGYLGGELTLLNLRALAGLWKIAWQRKREQLSTDLLAQIHQESDRVQREVGGIWAWRARLFVEQMQQAVQYGPEIAEQIRVAQAAYQQGQLDEAIIRYRQVADLAVKRDRPEIAAEMMFTGGSILLQKQQFAEAEKLFREGVDRFPETERAADCHLMWAWCLGKQYEQKPTKSHRLRYTESLDEHLELYEMSSTTGDANLMYGQFQENRLQVTKALEHYLKVPLDHPKSVMADVAALRSYEKILKLLREQDRSLDAWQEEAIMRLTQRASAYPPESVQLSLTHCRVLLGIVSLQLGKGDLDDQDISRDLSHVIEACSVHSQSSSNVKQWQEMALAAYRLNIVFLAQSGEIRKAEALVSRVAQAGRQPLLELLNGLSAAAAQASPQTKRGIGELQLQASLALNEQRDQLSKEELALLDRSLARSYLLSERSREAHELYEKLLKENADDIQLRRELAESLSKCGTVACHRRALIHWRYLENQSQQGTTDWLKLRAEVIGSLVIINQTDEAKRLLSVTELLYPQINNESLKQRYAELKQKIGR